MVDFVFIERCWDILGLDMTSYERWQFLVIPRRYLYEMGDVFLGLWEIFVLAYAIVGDVHITG